MRTQGFLDCQPAEKAEIYLNVLGILYTEIHATRDVVQVKSERHGPLGTAQEYERVCNIQEQVQARCRYHSSLS